MRPSKYRSLLRGFIHAAEAEGLPVTLDLNHDKPTVQADFSDLFADAPPVRRPVRALITEEQLASMFEVGAPANSTRQHETAIPKVVPATVAIPKPSIRERWQQYRQDRHEERRFRKPRTGMRRAIGALATVSILAGAGMFTKASFSETPSQQNITPVVAEFTPETTQPNTTTPQPLAEQAGPQLTQEQSRAVITIASGRYAIELAHPEFSQAQVDQQLMATIDYAVMVQNATS